MYKIILTILVIATGVAAYANTCPTQSELKLNLETYQLKSLSLMSSNATEEQAIKLLNDMDNYVNSVIPACVQYFQTTKVPDCSRLGVMTGVYYVLDKNKQANAKAQIYKIMENLPQSCESAIYVTKQMIK